MLGVIVAFLLKLIIAFGIGALLSLIARVTYVTLKHVKEKLASWIKKKVGYTTVAAGVKKVAEQLKKDAEKKNNKISLSELEEALEGDGVMLANMDENGDIVGDVEIVLGDEMDSRLKTLLASNDDCVVVTA